MNKRRGCFRFALTLIGALVLLSLLGVAVAWLDNRKLPVQSDPLDLLSDQDKAHLVEAMRLKETFGDQVLPGWSSANLAFILYNEKYAFLVGVNQPPTPGWQTVPRGTQRGNAWEVAPDDLFQGQPYYRSRLASPNDNPQSFTVQVGDTWVASLSTHEWMRIRMMQIWREELPTVLEDVFPYRPAVEFFIGSSETHIGAILHEAAHAYQGQAAGQRLAEGEWAGLNWENAYPWEDASLQEAWQQELDLLQQALRAGSEQEARELARQFLAQREQRRIAAGLSPDQVAYERNREWVEGIGKYAERRLLRIAGSGEGGQPVTDLQADSRFHAYQDSQVVWENEVDQMGRMAGDEGDGRFYYTGWSQAVLLDRLSPGWQARLFDPGVWLEDLLREAVGSS